MATGSSHCARPGLDGLAGEIERHELHEARGRVVLGGVLGEEHLALGVEEEDGLRAQRERPSVRRLGARGRHDDDGEQERDAQERDATHFVIVAR